MIVVSFVGAILPIKMFFRGTAPEVQAYQDSKGSWLSYGLANTLFEPIYLVSAVIGILGISLVVVSRKLEKQRIRKVMERRKFGN